jgi:hypothetical protein
VVVFVTDADAETDPPRFSYFRGDELRHRGTSLTRLLEYAIWDFHASASDKTRDFLLLHAGSIARGGEAVFVAGQADVGKSSLVAASLELGFDYLSDELGAIDPVTERAYPFPKRISLHPSSLADFPGLLERLQDRQGLSEGLEGRFVRPEDLSASVATPSEIGSLVFPSLDREGPPRLTPLSRAEAVQRMASLSFNLYRFKDRGVVLLSRIAARAQAYQLDGGTVRERAALLADRLAH